MSARTARTKSHEGSRSGGRHRHPPASASASLVLELKVNKAKEDVNLFRNSSLEQILSGLTGYQQFGSHESATTA